MKKILLLLTLSLTLTLLSQNLVYAESPAASKTNKKETAQKLKERSEKMKEALNLTPDQQTKIKAIREQNREAAKVLRQNKELSKEAKIVQLKEMRKTTAGKIDSILTPEQRTKKEAFKKQNAGQKKNPV